MIWNIFFRKQNRNSCFELKIMQLDKTLLRRFLCISQQVLATSLILAGLNTLVTQGWSGLARDAVRFLRKLPGVNAIISAVLAGEVDGAMKLLINNSSSSSANSSDGNLHAFQIYDFTNAAHIEVRSYFHYSAIECVFTEQSSVLSIPTSSSPPEFVLKRMEDIHSSEQFCEQGKSFAYTYTSTKNMASLTKVLSSAYAKFAETSGANMPSHEKLLHEAWQMFMHTNALNPTIYKSLRVFENEIVSMTIWLMHGDEKVAGSLTSGGTESILMAVKAYRERARALRPHVTTPNMVVAQTVHPAFMKAAHYFDIKPVIVPVRAKDARMDVAAAARAIDKNTILLVGSAPQYCHGVVDPIEELSELALQRGLPLHVDACYGGFMLPWLEKLGNPIPLFDFRVKGVTSISADVHKYGYSSKGASVIMYRNAELRSYQYFSYAEWPGGLFVSPTMAGSRPGGMIAAAWAALVSIGQEGYMNIARDVWRSTQRLIAAVQQTPGIKLLAQPDMTCLAIVADTSNGKKVNIMTVADVMETKGWKMERQQLPNSLHMSILPQHTDDVVTQLIADLKAAVEEADKHPELGSEGTAGMYGMIATIPDKTIVDDFLIEFMSAMYTQRESTSVVKH